MLCRAEGRTASVGSLLQMNPVHTVRHIITISVIIYTVNTTTLSSHVWGDSCFPLPPWRCSFFSWPDVDHTTTQVTMSGEHVMGKEVKTPTCTNPQASISCLLYFEPLSVGIHTAVNWLDQNGNIQLGGPPVTPLTESLSSKQGWSLFN